MQLADSNISSILVTKHRLHCLDQLNTLQ